MASEEPPMFDPALKKKKKKKAVAFSEDPLGADADDLEPTNAPVKEVDEEPANEDSNMFDGMKKKKKKKAVAESDDLAAPSSPAPAEDVNGDNMFDGMKKKKKKKDVSADLGDEVVTPNPPEETAEEVEERIAAELKAVEENGDMFEGMKKKKKVRRDIPMELEASPTPEAAEAEPVNGSVEPNADDADMFLDMKKKKKKKSVPADLGDGEAPAEGAAAAGDDADFSDLRKKKKNASRKLDMEAFERELGEAAAAAPKPKKVRQIEDDDDEEAGEEIDLDGDLGDDPFAVDGDADVGEGDEKWLNTDRDYTYDELLMRFYRVLRQNNPELAGGKRRHTVPPPSLMRDGNKKTIFANIVDIAKRIHRDPIHVISFLFAELGTTGSVDGSMRLVIKGRFQQKQLENVLRRYIVEYVTCKTCKSPDTLLEKENRIFFVQCESCGSRRSVSAVKTGFQAQIGKRSKTKPVT